MNRTVTQYAFCTAILLAGAACSSSSSDGQGTATFTTWGEEYIEKEIPTKVGAETIVEDGWSIRYNKFLVNIAAVKVADAAGAVAGEMKTPKLFDHTKPGVKPVVSFPNVAAKNWTHVSYAILPATSDVDATNVTSADKELMVKNGYSVYIDAVATKGTATKKYTWGFKTNTLYGRCKGELGGKEVEGAVITNGGTDTMQLTVHGDHFYYDDLQAPEAKVRFDAIASADKDNDGTVTLEELATVKRAELRTADATYGAGEAPNIITLLDYVSALSRTLGHFRGEGECFASTK